MMDVTRTILFCEDDLLVLEDLTTIADWAGNGYQTITAVNGRQGLEKFRQYRPALVVTDVKMPLMDGLEMMSAIHEENPYVPFMMLSSYDDYPYMREAMRLGAADYIRKTGITGPSLLKKVETLMQTRETIIAEKRTLLKGQLRDWLDGTLRDDSFPLEAESLCACFAPEELAQPLLSYLSRLRPELTVKPTSSLSELLTMCRPSSTLYSPPVQQAVEYIRTHLNDPVLSNPAVAQAVGLSEKRLGLRFREETGQTMNEYITAVRMERAKALLDNGLMVYEAAEQCGYSSPQYFSSAFKAYTGRSPQSWKHRRNE
ncbi:MAG: helix-turn-helix domain-containing protein [Oscillospiraceae bacterium]|nr:helix-turn-helix domain-containing protein [Oscillospiraceae bacterium]